MGPGRRNKKQGMPATLEELGVVVPKRKVSTNTQQDGPSRKRRRATDRDVDVPKEALPSEPTKLVKLDRAMRQEREGKEAARKAEKKKQKLKDRLANNDAQVTVPIPPVVSADVEEEGDFEVEMEEELDAGGVALADIELDEDLLSAEEGLTEEMAEEGLDGIEEGLLEDIEEDSVFASEDGGDEQATANRNMYSEDEDDSDALEKLTAANIEGLSRKLDQEQAEVEAEAQAELEDAAMQTNIADEGLLNSEDQPGLAPDLQLLRSRITETIRVLGDFSKLADPNRSRADYTQRLLSDVCMYYGYNAYLAEKLFNLFTPAEAFAFFEANETPRPVVIRTNTLRTNRRTLAQALINRGVVLEPVGKWSKVGLQIFESPVPLGATPEYLAGHYILQAASSFLPVMALAPQPDERILDMAAAPGGKTTYISALMRNTGSVFANDSNRQRAKGLIGNIHRLGCKNTIVCNYDAQKAFPKILGGFDRILLDAPCSGTGVIGKDPSVKTSKNERDFLAIPHLQKQLLLAAVDSVDHASKTGGYIVYSTCSVTVEENEQVVQYILRKRPNVKIVDTGLASFGSEGFKNYMGKKFDERMHLTRRYFPHRENVDGFFVCKLKKTGPTPVQGVSAKPNGVSADHSEEMGVVNIDENLIGGSNDVDDAETEADDDFGGFNDEEDAKFIGKAEKKWLKSRGLDPRGADKDKAKHKYTGEERERNGEANKQTISKGVDLVHGDLEASKDEEDVNRKQDDKKQNSASHLSRGLQQKKKGRVMQTLSRPSNQESKQIKGGKQGRK